MMRQGKILIPTLVALIGCSSNDRGTISSSGTIESTEVTISSRNGAEVKRLYVSEGSRVREGDTLVVLDTLDLSIQRRQARSNADGAEAQFRLAVRGARSEDLLQAEANLKNAGDDLHRMEELFRSQSVTQKQIDDASTRYTVAQQTYEKLRVGSRSEEIEVARARRDQAVAQLDAAVKKIRDAIVLSPIGGVVTAKLVEEGEMVMPNSALVQITRPEKVHMNIYVTEAELANVQLGQKARIFVDGRPGQDIPGVVTYISPNAEFTPRNIQTKDDRVTLVFAVRIEAENPDLVLKPGMPADATLEPGVIY